MVKNKIMILLGLCMIIWPLIIITNFNIVGEYSGFMKSFFQKVLFVFQWEFNQIIFWIIWGFVFIILSLYMIDNKTFLFTLISFSSLLLFQLLYRYVLPLYMKDPNFSLFNPMGIHLHIICVSTLFMLVYKRKSTTVKYLESKLPIVLVSVIFLLCIYKNIEIIKSINYLIQPNEVKQLRVLKNDSEVLHKIGEPYLKFIIVSNNASEDALIILKNSKVLNIFSKSEIFNNIKNIDELRNNPSIKIEKQNWYFSYSPVSSYSINIVRINKKRNVYFIWGDFGDNVLRII